MNFFVKDYFPVLHDHGRGFFKLDHSFDLRIGRVIKGFRVPGNSPI